MDYKQAAKRSFGYEGLREDWHALLERSLNPRAPTLLYDLASEAGLTEGDLVLDAGCRDGRHSRELVTRFDCRVVGVDLVESGLREGANAAPEVWLSCGDLEALPFPSGSFDFVWCRDVLEMMDDPALSVGEFRRVLKPGAGMMLYVAFATDLLETRERARLFDALHLTDTGMNETIVDGALADAGFDVISKQHVSPEWVEHSIESGDHDLAESMLTISRMRRGRTELEAELGTEWYERLYAWSCWSVYLALGKLQTVAWGLRARG